MLLSILFFVAALIVTLGLFLVAWTASSGWLALGAVLALILMGFAYVQLRVAVSLRPLLKRVDQKPRWLKEFGEEHEKAIQRFLELFCEAFDLPKHAAFKVAPDDEVSEFSWEQFRGGDAGETERNNFYSQVEEEFHVQIPRNLAPSVELSKILTYVFKRTAPVNQEVKPETESAT